MLTLIHMRTFLQIRTEIWRKLPYTDHLNLRLTAQFTKSDIDTFVGVCGKITALEPEKYDFYQSVALHSCNIYDLDEPINLEFLLNPNILEKLDIRDQSPISLESIRAILAVSINLKSLKLRLTLNSSSEDVSQIVLQHLSAMKYLSCLQIRTAHRFVPEMKEITSNGTGQFNAWPRRLKKIILEMSDLPSTQLSRWKSVLDVQDNLETIVCSIGNIFWRFYEPVLRQNAASLRTVSLVGLRSWNLAREVDDPLDWSVFADFLQLSSIDLTCNIGGQHDTMNSVNFDAFPCTTVSEFFVSRIMLTPEAVERVYIAMINLQRGALDQIGNQGIERANELSWQLQQNELGEPDRWWRDDRLVDLLANAVFGLSMIGFLSVLLNKHGGDFTFGTLQASHDEINEIESKPK